MAVDPVGDSGCSGGVGYGDLNRAVQEFLSVKYVVDFLVFQKTVCVDAGSCYVEVLAYERCSLRNVVADLFLLVLCQLGDHRGIHAAKVSAKLCILKYHSLKRCISGTLANTK